MFLEECQILENKFVGDRYYLMKIQAGKSAGVSKAGQFFMLKCKNDIRVLRRPISLHFADSENSTLEFYYEVKGGGTNEFSSLKPGDSINVQGPLGNGFNTEVEDKEIMVIGGGMGIAPTKYLIEKLSKNNRVTFIAGGRDAGAVKILENLNLDGVKVCVVTDDGSVGEKGNVVSIMQKVLIDNKIDLVQTCGPHKMMEAVAKVALENDIECEVSLEERMACGIKACVGCSIKTLDGMKKVCYDGPVFNAKIIVDVNPKENVGCSCN
ncbi:MAG: dihydroorotate dehydrogenase electron transfer subunit [Cetobacterium sp.]|uniref:dihydroorotate dehydrogenase electron transfer subunit n=1 Tax=unclassified Cetobacterium TaxID=2630983 RepID=UPI00163C76D8|nr:dihydroorotate dehydrogenase electron transfer subunit [Cetobacterium sp. 2A]MBC2855733.1 dihydroorotate dehydrogenase electron transfer subunit [Cetobacterium sp. 2A]